MSNMQRIIVIVGPNASGKSELAVRLAKKFNGEIISADSRQVYRHLNIGTGKVAGNWVRKNGKNVFIYKNVPHYCIDFVDPKKQFTVAEFKKCAEGAIAYITSRGKIPIIAGGTGFWIDAVVYDINIPAVPPNTKLRKILEKKSTKELLRILKKADPHRAKTVEQKNPRRLIRAIEIAQALGRVPEIKKESPYNILWFGINPPKEILLKRIHTRLIARIKSGMFAEARRLRANKLPWKRFYELGLEYKYLADFLKKKISAEKLSRDIETSNVEYARRQMTWFKKNKKIAWFGNPKDKKIFQKVKLHQQK